MTRPTETVRTLRYTFNEAERLKLGIEASESVSKLGEIEADKKRVVKEYDARISEHEAMIGMLSEKVRTGYELRNIKCGIEYNSPRAGRKRIYRLDTFEHVEEVEMAPSEKDEPLPLVYAEPKKELNLGPSARELGGFPQPEEEEPTPMPSAVQSDVLESIRVCAHNSDGFREALKKASTATLEAARDTHKGKKRELIAAKLAGV